MDPTVVFCEEIRPCWPNASPASACAWKPRGNTTARGSRGIIQDNGVIFCPCSDAEIMASTSIPYATEYKV